MDGIDADGRVLTVGEPLGTASAVVVMLPGRSATGRHLLALAEEFPGEDVCYVALRSTDRSWNPDTPAPPWYDRRPDFSAGLALLDDFLAIAAEVGIPAERVLFVGFSAGGALASEYVRRNPRRYGGLAVFSGGLPGRYVSPSAANGSVDGMDVFVTCLDEDPLVPIARVHRTATVFERMDATVIERVYYGRAHTVTDEERRILGQMVATLTSPPDDPVQLA